MIEYVFNVTNVVIVEIYRIKFHTNIREVSSEIAKFPEKSILERLTVLVKRSPTIYERLQQENL